MNRGACFHCARLKFSVKVIRHKKGKRGCGKVSTPSSAPEGAFPQERRLLAGMLKHCPDTKRRCRVRVRTSLSPLRGLLIFHFRPTACGVGCVLAPPGGSQNPRPFRRASQAQGGATSVKEGRSPRENSSTGRFATPAETGSLDSAAIALRSSRRRWG